MFGSGGRVPLQDARKEPSSEQIRAAMTLHNAGDLEQALKAYGVLLAQFPQSVQCLQLAAMANLQLGDWETAKRRLKAALRKDPAFAPAHNAIGAVYKHEGHSIAAIDSFAIAARLSPENSDHHHNLGITCLEVGRAADALEAFNAAVNIDPNNAKHQYWRGIALKSLGHFEESATALRLVLATDRAHAGAWWQLADMNATNGDDVAALETLMQSLSDNKEAEAKICFALYRTLERHGDPKKGIQLLIKGNQIKRNTLDYDISKDKALFRRIIATFHSGLFMDPKNVGSRGVRPIYIVGMNRSGTTLVEQIVANHSLVHGCGELPIVGHIAQDIGSGKGRPFPEGVARWRDRDVQTAAARVFKDFASRVPSAMYATDKMPSNFLYVGLIKLMIPDALVIHCRRSLLDCCFANYRLLYTSGSSFSYDWNDLVQYYRLYENLMAHWDAVLPGQILTVRYEDVVDEVETQSRRILEYCGLPWEESCLNFHKTDRPIFTSSAAQVRQPIYKTALERWRPYESELRELLAETGENIDSLR